MLRMIAGANAIQPKNAFIVATREDGDNRLRAPHIRNSISLT
jgi:hypothetical protein